MSYSSEVLADSPLGYWRLGDAGAGNPTGQTSSSNDIFHPAAHGIDGDPDTYWRTNSGATGWLQVNLASATVITQYAIVRCDAIADGNPKDWTFEGSNNGTTWTVLDTRTGITWPTAKEIKRFTFSNSTAYSSYRLNVTANNGNANLSVADFSVLDVVDSSGNGRNMLSALRSPTFNATGLLTGDSDKAVSFASQALIRQPADTWMVVDTFTVEAWISTAVTGIGVVFSMDDAGGSPGETRRRWVLYLNAGKPNLSIYPSGGSGVAEATGTTSVNDGARHHLVGVVDNTAKTVKMYVDGTLEATASYTGNPRGGVDFKNPLTIASGYANNYSTGTWSPFTGTIDEVAYFGSALSGTRVTAHYSAGTGATGATASGTVAAVSGVSGAITSNQKVSGTVAAVSGVSGALYTPASTDHPVSGTVAAVSGASGDISVIPGGTTDHPVSGTVAATTSTQGAVGLRVPLSGTVEAISGASGAITARDVVDPLTRRPQYQIIVVQPDGTRLGELNKAQALSPLEHDFAGESWDFAMPAHDPKTALTLGARNEIQIWRGGQLLRWGPIIKRSGDDVQVRISCASVRWYLDQKAQIGKLPKTDLLVNGDFSDGETGWSFGYDPDSIPALPPLHSVVPEGADGSNALKISGADESQLVTNTLQTLTIFVPNEATYLSGGEQQILDFAATLPPAPVGVIEGHTADADAGTGYALSLARANAVRSTIMTVRPSASFTTVGKGETEPTGQGLDADRRVVIKYEGLLPADGHRQYAYQRLNYMVPVAAKWPMQVVFIGTIKILDYVASSKDGWSVYIHRVNPSDRAEVLDYGTAPLNAETPRGVWIKQECSIEVPADGVTYELEVRYYPPSGDALWDRGGLFPAERLGFVDVRQEHIIEHLVEHAQDPAMGNANLYILNRPGFSGVTRQRRYDFHEARAVGDAINDFMSLDDGLDVDVEVTPTQKFLASYYPRKGQDAGVTLALGGKVMRFDVQEDGGWVGNVAAVRADGSGPGQEESYAIDPDALGGLRLRRTMNAEQETPAWELGQAAAKQLARFKTPPLLWSITCDPKWTSWLLDRVKLGDTAHCVIDAHWAKIDGPVRIVGESLDPATDAITYDIDVEV